MNTRNKHEPLFRVSSNLTTLSGHMHVWSKKKDGVVYYWGVPHNATHWLLLGRPDAIYLSHDLNLCIFTQISVLSYSIYLITSHFTCMYTITPYPLRLISVYHPSTFRSPCRFLSFRPKCLYAPSMFHTRAACLFLLFLLDLITYYEALVSSPVIQKVSN